MTPNSLPVVTASKRDQDRGDPTKTMMVKKKGMRETFPAFPFEPYDVQEELMACVYKVLQKGGVGIVESPTGTGKTLSLLCSSLQWLVDKREEEEREEEEEEKKKSQEEDGSDSDSPDWIKDFEVEKRKSRLVKRVPALKREPKEDSSAVHWGGKRKESTERQTQSKKPSDESVVVDDFLLEESKESTLGKRGFALDDDSESESSDTELERNHQQILYCSRTHSQLSQVIKELRGTSLASQVSSAILGSRKGLCINSKVAGLKSISRINEQCIQLQQKKTKKSKTSKGGCGKCGCPFFRKKAKQDKLVNRILAKPMDIEDIGKEARTIESCGYYATRRAALDADIVFLPYNSVLSKSVRETSGVRIKGSVVIIDEAHNIADAVNNMHSVVLNLAHIQTAKLQVLAYYNRFKNMFKPSNDRSVQMLLRLMDALLKCFSVSSGSVHSVFPEKTGILTVNDFLSKTGIDNINIFKLSEFVRESKLFFKVSGYYEVSTAAEGSREEMEKLGSLNSVMDLLFALTNNEEDGRVIIDSGMEQIKFVMLNAATHFEELVQEAHAVVLAGGTLQPLEDLFLQVMPTIDQTEVQTLSCDHVIQSGNLLTMTVPKGPTGQAFDFVHSKRSSPDMIMDLGRLVVNACKVVPDGIVCFFPSYKYSEQVTSFWSKNGIMKLIEQKKKIFGEPKAADEVESVLGKFKYQIEDSQADDRGAILFCVVGGKMSEGINFSDRLGRCVILAGLPYPNIYDVELQERLKFWSPSSGTSSALENLTMKSVNQTIGRAIRHRDDYSTIILADRRYCSESGPFKKLPQWIKEANVVHCETFGLFYRNLVKFFQGKK